jgi:hypothetical protein
MDLEISSPWPVFLVFMDISGKLPECGARFVCLFRPILRAGETPLRPFWGWTIDQRRRSGKISTNVLKTFRQFRRVRVVDDKVHRVRPTDSETRRFVRVR